MFGDGEKAAAKKLSVSKSAVDEFSTIQDQLTPQEMTGIDRLPKLYLRMQKSPYSRKLPWPLLWWAEQR
jgi:hypothetical protein